MGRLVMALMLAASLSPALAAAETVPDSGISGTVTDSAGVALENVFVDVVNKATGDHREPMTFTTADGGFDIPLEPGDYSVEFWKDGHEKRSENFTVIAGDYVIMDLALDTEVVNVAVSGRLTDLDTGGPVAGLPVMAYVSDPTSSIEPVTVLSGDDGTYVFRAEDLAPATYRIQTEQDVAANERFYLTEHLDEVTWNGTDAQTDLDFQLSGEFYSFIVMVQDEDGLPLDYKALGITPVVTKGDDQTPLWPGVHANESPIGKLTWYFLEEGEEYRLGFIGNEEYETQWYDKAAEWSHATTFTASPEKPADLGVVTLTAAGGDPGDPTVPEGAINIAGSDRFSTAVRASKEAYPVGGSVDTVVIATGRNWPDALGGTALAGVIDGPILLVDTDVVPSVVHDEITRLGAKNAIILGGTAAVDIKVENALKVKLEGEVERLSGSNRYATADRIAKRVIAEQAGGYDGQAFVATGGNFPDALAAAPLAAAKGWPLYLADPATGLTAGTKAAMAGVDRALVLGGEAVVSGPVEAELKAMFGEGSVERVDGPNRYATAVAVAGYGVKHAGLHWGLVGITTGENFPDALAGGVVQGKAGSVMLLTRSYVLETATASAIKGNKGDIDTVTYFGGANAVSPTVREAVANALK